MSYSYYYDAIWIFHVKSFGKCQYWIYLSIVNIFGIYWFINSNSNIALDCYFINKCFLKIVLDNHWSENEDLSINVYILHNMVNNITSIFIGVKHILISAIFNNQSASTLLQSNSISPDSLEAKNGYGLRGFRIKNLIRT